MELSYIQYENVLRFAIEGRKYYVTSPIHTKDEYQTIASINDIISIDCEDHINEKKVIIYMLLDSTKYKATRLRHLLTVIHHITDVIIIAASNIANIINKLASSFNNLNIYVYPHYIFSTNITKGPFCYPHRVLSKEESNRLLNNHMYAKLTDFPIIDELDPQCIWIGAKIGNIIEIKSCSPTGEVIQYRVVFSKSVRSNNRRLAELGKELSVKEDEKNIDLYSDVDEKEEQEEEEPKDVPADVLYALDPENIGTDDEEENELVEEAEVTQDDD